MSEREIVLPKPTLFYLKHNGGGAAMSVQCFENRHDECSGKDVLFGCECECFCHAPKQEPRP